ncbi:MAG: histidine kinase [Firmicutes bacterium]|nr:histidine kinase [Bacillota bacterium]
MKVINASWKNRPKKARDILIAIVVFSVSLIAFLTALANIDLSSTTMKYDDRYIEFKESWVYSSRGGAGIITDLPYWANLEPGEDAVISRTIPRMDSPYYAFVTRNYHQRITAYINGEQIYEYPSATESLTEVILTDDWLTIRVPQDSVGKIFSIKIHAGLDGYNGYINPPFFGEDNAIFAHLRDEYKVPYALGVSLIAIGFLLILVSTIYTRNFSERRHFLLGFVFISLGLWFADRSRMPVFLVGSNMKFFMAFSVLNLVPLLIVLYIGERFKHHNQLVVNCMTVAAIILDLVLFSTAAVGKAPFHALVPYVYIAILIALLYAIYLMLYYAFGKGRKFLNRIQLNSARLEFISAIILIVGSALGLLWDAFSTNNWSSSHREWSGVGTIQVLSVVIFAFFHFIILVYNSYYSALDSEATQKLLHDSQLQLMMGQIQPHFMFNTLSSIRTLIKVDPDVAYDMVYNFSNYLRANVDNLTNLEGIPFSSEVQHIQSYVEIEKVRFGDRLNVEYDIQESEFLVPPLAIQPLVENAIKHGVCKRPEGGTVWIRSYSDGYNNIVEVADNGVGIPPERMEYILGNDDENYFGDSFGITGGRELNLTGNGSESHRSTGMKNIIMRLQEMSHAELKIESEVGKGTLMRVIFPQL